MLHLQPGQASTGGGRGPQENPYQPDSEVPKRELLPQPRACAKSEGGQL